jgi:hypothetical protein
MRAGFSFSYPPISLLLGQPLSIKKSYAGAIHKASGFLSGNYIKKISSITNHNHEHGRKLTNDETHK